MKKLLSILLMIALFIPQTSYASGETVVAYAEAKYFSTNANNVSVFGGTVSENPTLAYKGGKACWVLGTTSTVNSRLYLDFDNTTINKDKANYRLDIKYYDFGRGMIVFKYNSSGTEVSTKPIICTGSNGWKTASVDLYGMRTDNPFLQNHDLQVYTYIKDDLSIEADYAYISSFALYDVGTVCSSNVTFTTTGMDKNFKKGNQTISYKLENIMSDARNYTVSNSVYDEDGNLIWRNEALANQKLGVNAAKLYTVNMDINKYGVHTLCVEVSDDNGGYAKSECDFAVMQNGGTNVHNKDFGMSAHFSWVDKHITTMPLFTQLGVGCLRDEVLWKDYINAGNKIPQRHERYLNAMADAGVEVLLVLGPDPYYKVEDFPRTDEQLKAFGEYVYELVNDTKGRVQYFEVWNEYNMTDSVEEAKKRGREYAKLLRVAYDNAKLANPECKILGPVTAGWSWHMADGMLEEDPDIAECMDMISFHSYPRNKHAESSEWLSTFDSCIQDIKDSFGEDKKIWLTEFGWSENDYGTTQKDDAMYTVRALLQNDETKMFDKMFRYNWINSSGTDKETFGHNLGVINADYFAKKVYLACDAMNEFIADATYVSRNTDNNKNYFYKYKSGDKKDITVVFNEDNIKKTVRLEPTFEDNRLYDMYGNEIDMTLNNGAYEATVDGRPCYFVSTDSGVDMMYETNTAVIRGRIEGGKQGDPFMIYVMNPDKTKDDMLSADALCYVEFGTVGEDGNYDFSFPMDADAGEYKVYIGYQNGKKAIGPATLRVKRDVVASTSLFAGDKKIATFEEIEGAETDKLKVQGNIDNSYNARLSAVLYAAGYKGNAMLWANKISAEPNIVGDNEMSFEIDKSKALEADEIRIFLWKDDMSPLVEQVTPIK